MSEKTRLNEISVLSKSPIYWQEELNCIFLDPKLIRIFFLRPLVLQKSKCIFIILQLALGSFLRFIVILFKA